MRRRRHRDRHGVACIDQPVEGVERGHAKLSGDLLGAVGAGVVKPDHRGAFDVAEQTNVVVAYRAGAGHADSNRPARGRAQNPTPRWLSSMNWRKCSTTGSGWSSARARSIACDTLSSERKNRRYARFSSRTTSSGKPLRWSPTLLSP